MQVREHEHDFITILVGSEMRQRCRLCTAVRLVNAPGDSDVEVYEKMVTAESNEAFIQAMAKLLQRQYERETGLPAFAASYEYAMWLKNRK